MDAPARRRWWRAAGLTVLALACAALFAAYLRPDMVVSFSNAVMALCGF